MNTEFWMKSVYGSGHLQDRKGGKKIILVWILGK